MGSSGGVQPLSQEREDEVFGYAMQLASGSVLPLTLHAAIELGIFEIVAKAGDGSKLSTSEIAAQMQTLNPDAPMMLDRVLRLLASHSVLTCSLVGSQKVYGLAPVAKYFVPSQDDISLGKMMDLLQDKVFLDSCNVAIYATAMSEVCTHQGSNKLINWIQDAILNGGVPFERAHGTHLFAHPDPRFNQIFNTAMINKTKIVMEAILKSYKGFERLTELVDVGGGLGANLSLIASKYPSLKGINFDLPQVIELAPRHPGVEYIGGDMFESIPKGDAIFMKWILHDWNDDACLKLLRNCYNAIPDEGMVIVVEFVLPTMPETSAVSRSIFHVDMLLMTQTHEGKERTQEEFIGLATGAGFRGIRFVTSACGHWVMEFYK